MKLVMKDGAWDTSTDGERESILCYDTEAIDTYIMYSLLRQGCALIELTLIIFWEKDKRS